MNSENYIIVTPCKDEEKNLLKLANSVINNTVKPSLWVIFNDGSIDNTKNILDNLESKYDWIKVIHSGIFKRDLGFHYSEIVNTAIEYAFKVCEKQNISFEYIGLIDADMILDEDFFEKIIQRFRENPNLGVCSGSVVYVHKNRRLLEEGRINHPIGGLRVWRKKCLVDTGLFPHGYSADSISNVLAILKGWDTIKYNDIIGIQTRKTSSAEGLWRGFTTRGKSDYYRNYHPAYIILKTFKYSIRYPFYTGIAYFFGYVTGIFVIKDKIDIPEVSAYYRNKHLELFNRVKKN